MTEPASDRLDSWKAIAEYLRRDVATVRRWERERGLPAHRVPGGRGASVFAYRSEIDAWLRAKNDTTVTVPPRRHAWAIGTVAAAMTLAVVWRLHSAPITIPVEDLKIAVGESAVVATDPRGAEMWRYRTPAGYRLSFSEYGDRSVAVSGVTPAVYAISGTRVRLSDSRVESGELMEFSADGVLRRTFAFDDHVTFDRQRYGTPWGITALAVDESHGSRRIAVAAHHFEWSASVVTVLDENFRRLGTYWQWGWIEGVRWLGPDRLLIAGFNDARDGGMVALLDPSTMNGQSPEAAGAHGYCDDCGRTSPVKMVVMPRSELNRATQSRFNRVQLEVLPDRIVARTIEVPQGTSDAVDALYEFSPQLDLVRASFSGPYLELHDALSARGQLDHDRQHCPDRSGPRQILTWDRDRGWQPLHISHPT